MEYCFVICLSHNQALIFKKKQNTKTQKTNAQILFQFTYQEAVYLFSQTHVLWVNIIERAT